MDTLSKTVMFLTISVCIFNSINGYLYPYSIYDLIWANSDFQETV